MTTYNHCYQRSKVLYLDIGMNGCTQALCLGHCNVRLYTVPCDLKCMVVYKDSLVEYNINVTFLHTDSIYFKCPENIHTCARVCLFFFWISHCCSRRLSSWHYLLSSVLWATFFVLTYLLSWHICSFNLFCVILTYYYKEASASLTPVLCTLLLTN